MNHTTNPQDDRPFHDEPTEVLETALGLASEHAAQAARFAPPSPDDALPAVADLFRDELQHREAAMTDSPTPQPAEEPLTHVGWWCWRGDNHGHLATQPCRSDNVPLHAPADWADEMRAVIQRIEDGDEDEAPAAQPSAVVSADRATLRDRIAALHQPIEAEGGPYCETCTQEERQPQPVGWWTPWPCPTMQAVDAALPAPADGPSRVAAEEQPAECTCEPAPHREQDGSYSHWAGCPVADAEQAPAVGEQTDTQTREAGPRILCNWARTRTEHLPHGWEPQPGMDPVHCPGYSQTAP